MIIFVRRNVVSSFNERLFDVYSYIHNVCANNERLRRPQPPLQWCASKIQCGVPAAKPQHKKRAERRISARQAGRRMTGGSVATLSDLFTHIIHLHSVPRGNVNMCAACERVKRSKRERPRAGGAPMGCCGAHAPHPLGRNLIRSDYMLMPEMKIAFLSLISALFFSPLFLS